jgi:hypothetical protein
MEILKPSFFFLFYEYGARQLNPTSNLTLANNYGVPFDADIVGQTNFLIPALYLSVPILVTNDWLQQRIPKL